MSGGTDPNKISEPTPPTEDPAPQKTTAERVQVERAKTKDQLERERYHQETARLKEEAVLRSRIGNAVFLLLLLWLFGVLAIVIWQGIVRQLSDAVLIALLTTTTVNVIALPLGVIRYLLSTPQERKESPQSNHSRARRRKRTQPTE